MDQLWRDTRSRLSRPMPKAQTAGPYGRPGTRSKTAQAGGPTRPRLRASGLDAQAGLRHRSATRANRSWWSRLAQRLWNQGACLGHGLQGRSEKFYNLLTVDVS